MRQTLNAPSHDLAELTLLRHQIQVLYKYHIVCINHTYYEAIELKFASRIEAHNFTSRIYKEISIQNCGLQKRVHFTAIAEKQFITHIQSQYKLLVRQRFQASLADLCIYSLGDNLSQRRAIVAFILKRLQPYSSDNFHLFFHFILQKFDHLGYKSLTKILLYNNLRCYLNQPIFIQPKILSWSHFTYKQKEEFYEKVACIFNITISRYGIRKLIGFYIEDAALNDVRLQAVLDAQDIEWRSEERGFYAFTGRSAEKFIAIVEKNYKEPQNSTDSLQELCVKTIIYSLKQTKSFRTYFGLNLFKFNNIVKEMIFAKLDYKTTKAILYVAFTQENLINVFSNGDNKAICPPPLGPR